MTRGQPPLKLDKRVEKMAELFNIYTTYYESYLALSVSIRVDKQQMMMETLSQGQAPVLQYRDITFTTEKLKDSLNDFFPVLGIHNVARVRQGALPLFEVDFADEQSLEMFCKSLYGSKCLHNDPSYNVILFILQE